MESVCEFISGAANTVSDGAHWFSHQKEDFIVYSCHNLILIANVHTSNVICSLKGHEKGITSIAVLYDDFQVTILSGSDDFTVRVWSHTWTDAFTIWNKSTVHTMKGSVNAISACYDSRNRILLAVSDVLGNQNVLFQTLTSEVLSAPKFQIVDTAKMSPSQIAYSLQLHVSKLSNTESYSATVFLFVGCVDSKVYVRVSTIAIIESITFSSETSNSKQAFTTVGSLSGHEEWVTCLHTYTPVISLASPSSSSGMCRFYLASGSKDAKIRVWRIDSRLLLSQVESDNIHRESNIALDLISAQASVAVGGIDDNDDDDEEDDVEEGGVERGPIPDDDDEDRSEARLHFKTPLTTSNHKYVLSCSVYLEALLVGHEDWVTTVQFMNQDTSLSSTDHTTTDHLTTSIIDRQLELSLFSTSMDRNMVIWKPDTISGIWMPTVRIGDIGGQLGGCVGGNLLGFVGGSVCADSRKLIGVGYGGSLHLWKQGSGNDVVSGDHSSSGYSDRWSNIPFLTGHFGSVNDLVWDERGQYLMTVSSDQTCRLFAIIKSKDTLTVRQWKEVSRPQIHGYDLNCLVLLHDKTHSNSNDNSSSSLPTRLITAGDEKLIRVFIPPQTVVEGVRSLCPSIPSVDLNASVYQAAIPELSLSNKAVTLLSKQELEESSRRNVYKLNWDTTPVDSQLSDYTVWPEDHKFFGHANDVMCLAINSAGTLLASACKAKDKNSAKIMIWNLQTYACLYTLDEHDSTIVTMRFSPNDQYLVTSGKDRLLCLFARDSVDYKYKLVSITKNAHKRIVWDCCWSKDSTQVYTVSRDGFMKIWSISTASNTNSSSGVSDEFPVVSISCVLTISPFDGISVTSIDLFAVDSDNTNTIPTSVSAADSLVAVGSETGDVSIWQVSSDGLNASLAHSISDSYCHGSAVKRVRWCSNPTSEIDTSTHIKSDSDRSKSTVYLASCGEDNTVRVFSFCM